VECAILIYMKITVDVTQECIDKGNQSDAFCCPVALAIGKAISADELTEVCVLPEEVSVLKHSDNPEEYGSLEGQLPSEVTNFITAFDSGYQVEPLFFELELNEEEPNTP
jgi:hypothetical protein